MAESESVWTIVFCYFAMSCLGFVGWNTLNSLFLEAPLFLPILPEHDNVSTYLLIAQQVASAVVFIPTQIFENKAKDWYPTIIVVTNLLQIASTVVLIASADRSVNGFSLSFIGMAFVSSICGYVSTTFFMPFVSLFHAKYTNAYTLGLGLSLMFCAVVSLIQGSGLDHPRFSFRIFFAIILISDVIGFAAVLWLLFSPQAKTQMMSYKPPSEQIAAKDINDDDTVAAAAAAAADGDNPQQADDVVGTVSVLERDSNEQTTISSVPSLSPVASEAGLLSPGEQSAMSLPVLALQPTASLHLAQAPNADEPDTTTACGGNDDDNVAPAAVPKEGFVHDLRVCCLGEVIDPNAIPPLCEHQQLYMDQGKTFIQQYNELLTIFEDRYCSRHPSAPRLPLLTQKRLEEHAAAVAAAQKNSLADDAQQQTSLSPPLLSSAPSSQSSPAANDCTAVSLNANPNAIKHAQGHMLYPYPTDYELPFPNFPYEFSSVRISIWYCYLFLIQAILSAIGFGVVPSLLSYSAGSYYEGNTIYMYGISVLYLVDPFARTIYSLPIRELSRTRHVILTTTLSSIFAIFLTILACVQPHHLPLRDHRTGGALAITASGACGFFYAASFVNSFALMFRVGTELSYTKMARLSTRRSAGSWWRKFFPCLSAPVEEESLVDHVDDTTLHHTHGTQSVPIAAPFHPVPTDPSTELVSMEASRVAVPEPHIDGDAKYLTEKELRAVFKDSSFCPICQWDNTIRDEFRQWLYRLSGYGLQIGSAAGTFGSAGVTVFAPVLNSPVPKTFP